MDICREEGREEGREGERQLVTNKGVLITINYYLVLTIHCKILNTSTVL